MKCVHAEAHLKQQRQQKRHGADRGAKQRAAIHRDAKGRHRHRIKADHRERRAAKMAQREEKRPASRQQQRACEQTVRVARCQHLHRAHQRHHRQRGGEKTGRIERAAIAVVAIGNKTPGERHRDKPRRQVNKEDPAPVRVAGDKPAKRRPDNGRHQCGPGQCGDSRNQLMFRRDAQHRETANRHHQRAARAL
ncbi:200 kDa antigen p200, putative [Cronobacter malonaticus 681]|nr:200 kDa antigen p200, putative [Cronobacter malonaticus 681]